MAALLKKYSELEFENGVLKSERDELKYELQNMDKNVTDQFKREFSNKVYSKINATIRNKDEKIKMLRKSASSLCAQLNIENENNS